ncbi:MAG: multi-sensor hybrid histidine kinase [Rariglobus sp.]|nr:multi-sensor hybrid histidine kinase [Rariglobus sp.]
MDLARSTCPEIPFILVSGTIGEDRAVEILKSGAVDYVLKTKLDRLRPAVDRALAEAAARATAIAAQAALRRSEERFREMAERIGDVFYVIDLDTGHRPYVSPAYAHIWGRTVADLYANPAQWTAAIFPEDLPPVLAAREQLIQGREFCIEYRVGRPDGTLRWIEDRGYFIEESAGGMKRAIGVARDITSHRQLEAQLRQAQKMEAVGQLAGGLAHDFNNVLTVVIGCARLLLDRGTMPSDSIRLLTHIFNAGTRAANLTRQLLVFSNKHVIDRRTIDLNQVTTEMSEMLPRLIGEHITLDLVLSKSPCLVDGDSGMIEQVLMNLTVNARDAMPDGGRLTISTEHLTIDNASTRNHPGARAGQFISLSVRDTGCGIPAENLQQIFEPFFTTKEIGHGTGLGLAMVLGIVQQHQGWVEVASAPGTGTCFRILLPALPATSPLGSEQPAKPAAAAGGLETLLLVEDEPNVREFAVAVLGSHGYRVLQAASGVEALEVWQRHQSRISLLVTDLVMPDGLSGHALALRLRKDKPELKVVITSGYMNEAGAELEPIPDMHFVHKPYRPQTLADAVRNTLDGNPDPDP